MSVQISVVIPVRNRIGNLRGTVEAIAQQSFVDFELIISDDNSDDGVIELYHQYKNRLKIKYVNNNTKPHTWNASIPRNLGAQIASRESSAYYFVDSDVVLPINALESMWQAYNANPNRVLIGSYDFTTQNGDLVQYPNGIKGDVRSNKFQEVSPDDTFDSFTDGLACFGGNIFFPKEIFWSVGGYSEDIHIGLEDGEMGIKLWKKNTKFSYINAARGRHQWHESPIDRFPSDMRKHIDYMNNKHFGVNTDYMDKNMDIVIASKETYKEWGIDNWQPPHEWNMNRLDLGLKINK